MLTDPPYTLLSTANICGLSRIRHREFAIGFGEMSEAEFTAFLQTVFDRLAENTMTARSTTSAWIGGACGDARRRRQGLQRAQEPVCLNKSNAAWDRSTARSTSWCSCGSPVPQRTSTISSSASIVAIGQMSGTMLASIRCARDDGRVGDASDRQARRLGRRRDQGLLAPRRLVLDPFCGSGTTFDRR